MKRHLSACSTTPFSKGQRVSRFIKPAGRPSPRALAQIILFPRKGKCSRAAGRAWGRLRGRRKGPFYTSTQQSTRAY